MSEVKQGLQHLTGLSAKLRGQLEELKGAGGEEMRKGFKAAGTRFGIGVGVALFGLIVLIGAALYINALLIILFDLFLPLWAAALIVVLGEFLLGAAIAGVGALIARKAVRDFPKAGGPVLEEIKATGQELKEALDELQARIKEQREQQQQKMKEAAEQLKKAAPFLIAVYVGYRGIKGMARSRKLRRMYLEEV